MPLTTLQPAVATDAQLMKRLQSGEIAPLGILFERYGQYVESAIWRFAPSFIKEEVEDLTQDVFLRVWQIAYRYQEKDRFQAWLYEIAVQVARHAKRNWALRFNLRRKNPGIFFGGGTKHTENLEDRTVIKDALQKAMDKLPRAQWEVILLFTVEGFTAAEIAKILRIRPEAVWTRLSRARGKLLMAIEKNDNRFLKSSGVVPCRGKS